MADAPQAAGCTHHRGRREFRLGDIPIRFVSAEQTRVVPAKFTDIDGVRTVSLPDLINIKLSSGLRDPLRAIDIADVIGLIRARKLTSSYTTKLAKPIHAEFRKLARAISKTR